MEGIFAWVAEHGYGALYLLLALGVVGLPIPDETLLVFTGYLIGRGTLNPVGAFAAAVAGAWTGISGSYLLGRTLGVGAVHRYGKYVHFTEARWRECIAGSTGSATGCYLWVTTSRVCGTSPPW